VLRKRLKKGREVGEERGRKGSKGKKRLKRAKEKG